MPFCCQCGKPTGETDQFCGSCGARQPGTAPTGAGSGMSPRTASMLCYIPIAGWIPAIIALASRRFSSDRDVRFHAFQGIYLFVAWLIVDWVIGPARWFSFWGHWHIPALGGILKAVIFVAWIFMLIKASRGEMYKLPLLGELAERSVAEQRN